MRKIHTCLMLIALSLSISVVFVSCDEPEPDISKKSENITAPKQYSNPTYTDYDGVTFRVIFRNGGDTNANMNCTVHWCKYSSKQSKTPSRSDMTNHESMRQYGSTGKTITTFDKAHAGLSGGTYIYYYFECSNSKHTTTTDVTYCVIKRTPLN